MNENKKRNSLLSHGSSRHGTVSVATTAAAVAIVILLNLIVGRLPSNIKQIDISGQKLYSVSERSKEYLSTLDTEIELIMLSELGTADERITKFVSSYASLSGHISVETIDPVLYPSVLDTYSAELNSLVVKNSETGKYRVIPYTGVDGALILHSVDWSTYESYESGFDAEGQITSAIDYVSQDSSGTIYNLKGHGESDLGEKQTELINKSNITLSDDPVDILLDGGIPDDCDLIIMNDPKSDISIDEKDIILRYLADGGDMLIVLDNPDLQNLKALLSDYGMDVQNGYIGDKSRFYQQYYSFYGYFCFAPIISTSHELTSGLDTNAFTIYPRGMLLTDPARNTITTTEFLTTSGDGESFIEENNSVIDTFVLGAVAVENIAQANNSEGTESAETARLTVVTSTQLFSDNILTSFPSMANSAIFSNIVTAGFDDVSNIVIPAKSLEVSNNTINSYQWWSLLYIGIIPVCVLVVGLVRWAQRRKR